MSDNAAPAHAACLDAPQRKPQQCDGGNGCQNDRALADVGGPAVLPAVCRCVSLHVQQRSRADRRVIEHPPRCRSLRPARHLLLPPGPLAARPFVGADRDDSPTGGEHRHGRTADSRHRRGTQEQQVDGLISRGRCEQRPGEVEPQQDDPPARHNRSRRQEGIVHLAVGVSNESLVIGQWLEVGADRALGDLPGPRAERPLGAADRSADGEPGDDGIRPSGRQRQLRRDRAVRLEGDRRRARIGSDDDVHRHVPAFPIMAFQREFDRDRLAERAAGAGE